MPGPSLRDTVATIISPLVVFLTIIGITLAILGMISWDGVRQVWRRWGH